jgi:hypothetical protein
LILQRKLIAPGPAARWTVTRCQRIATLDVEPLEGLFPFCGSGDLLAMSKQHTSTTEHPARLAARGQAYLGIDPFELFCAYHLGITAENHYRFQNLHQVARRFGVEAEEVQEALRRYGLDPDVLLHTGFDLASAQADVQLSPAGVDLTVLARMHYEALLDSEPNTRDWEGELEQAARENELIFGGARGDKESEP